MPAWQKRQPRVQPRNSSMTARLCTASMLAILGRTGQCASSREGMTALSARAEMPGTYTPGMPAAFARKSRLPPPARLFSTKTAAIRSSVSSPSPMLNRSTMSDMGAGLTVHGPPAMTTGSASLRSARRTGTCPNRSMYTTLEYDSSYWSEKPTISCAFIGEPSSNAYSGMPLSLSSRPMSGHGAKQLWHSVSGRMLSISYRMRMPRLDMATSYTSGRHRRYFSSGRSLGGGVFSSPPV